MISLIISVLFALITTSLQRYFVLLWLCVFHVLGLVYSLLLNTFVRNGVRDRTGPEFAGGGLGGMFEWNYCISYIIYFNYQSQSPSSYFSYFYYILFDFSSFSFSLLCFFFCWLFAFLFLFLFLFFRAFSSLSFTASASYWTIKHYSED